MAPALLHFIDRTAAVQPYVPAGFLVPVKEKLLPGLYNRITRTRSLRAPDQKFIPMLLAACTKATVVSIRKNLPVTKYLSEWQFSFSFFPLSINNTINLLRSKRADKRDPFDLFRTVFERFKTNKFPSGIYATGKRERSSAGHLIARS